MRFCIVTLLLWGLFFLRGMAAAQEPPALTPKNPIPLTKVEGRMDHLGVDVKGRRLFATAFDNHTLEVIDLKTGRQVRTIRDLDEPQGSYYDAATNRLFVACGGDGTVKIFDGITFQLLQTVTLGLDADNVRYDARSKHIVVGYGGEKFLAGKVTRPGGGGALAILDSTGKKTREIAMDAHPESFQLEKTGTRVFVNVPDRQEVEVADLVKGTVLARWQVSCTTNFPMALDEAHHRLLSGVECPRVWPSSTPKRARSWLRPRSLNIPMTSSSMRAMAGSIFSAKASSRLGRRKTPISMNASGAIPRLPTGVRVCLYPTWGNSSKPFRTTASRAPKFSCMRQNEA